VETLAVKDYYLLMGLSREATEIEIWVMKLPSSSGNSLAAVFPWGEEEAAAALGKRGAGGGVSILRASLKRKKRL
jgi:hypothetical protein